MHKVIHIIHNFLGGLSPVCEERTVDFLGKEPAFGIIRAGPHQRPVSICAPMDECGNVWEVLYMDVCAVVMAAERANE